VSLCVLQSTIYIPSLNYVFALKVAILSPLDDINTNTPLIAIPPDTEVNIDLYPEIKITDPETRSVPKVKFSRFMGYAFNLIS
jgi:hypothetical protein